MDNQQSACNWEQQKTSINRSFSLVKCTSVELSTNFYDNNTAEESRMIYKKPNQSIINKRYLLVVSVVVPVQPARVGPPAIAIATAAHRLVAIVGSAAVVPLTRRNCFLVKALLTTFETIHLEIVLKYHSVPNDQYRHKFIIIFHIF